MHAPSRNVIIALQLFVAAALGACGEDSTPAPGADVQASDSVEDVAVPDGADPNDTAPETVAPDLTEIPDIPSGDLIHETTLVTFTVQIPVETPRDAEVQLVLEAFDKTVALDCGDATTTCRVTVELIRSITWRWHLALDTAGADALVALDRMGAPVSGETVTGPVSALAVDATVERWGPAEGASAFAIAFVARVPGTTPRDEAIHISGSAPALGDWDGRGIALRPARLGTHAAVATLEGVRSVAFKATRGSWYTVEKGPNDEELADRRSDVGGGLRRVEVDVARWADLVPRGTGTYTGDVRILRGVPSETLDNQRDLYVWLPPGYRDTPAAAYPVLYLHDGQNTMDAGSAFSGVEWQVDEALGGAIAAGAARPVIAVAIANTSGRNWEYTPTPDPSYGGGGLEAYGQFVVETVMPTIDAHFRTRTDAASTGLVGSSLGGLASLGLGLSYPEIFGRLGVVSPSVWWDGRVILDIVGAWNGTPSAHIWLDIGTAEGDGSTTVANTRALRDALVAKGWVLDASLTYREFDGAGHNERAWAARFPAIVSDLFAP